MSASTLLLEIHALTCRAVSIGVRSECGTKGVQAMIVFALAPAALVSGQGVKADA